MIKAMLQGGCAIGALLCAIPAAQAQDVGSTAETAAAASGGFDEIIVTARRRDETAIAVPASIIAIGAEQIERQGIRSFDDLAMLTPSLTVGQATSGVGGSIVLRGIGTAAGTNPSFDQTVTVNIDGVQISRGNALRMGQIDMGSIEILKGPQALFFGKNSPAGVISIKTADPTDDFESMIRATYDPSARGVTGDAFVSGAIADGLKIRLAGSISRTQGWFKNDAEKALSANDIRPGTVTVTDTRGPRSKFYFGRATVIAEPTDKLSLRGKFTYSHNRGDWITFGQFQRFYCASGKAALGSQLAVLGNLPGLADALAVDDCKADDHYTNGDLNPAFQNGATDDVGGSYGGSRSTFRLASLEANYDLSDSIRLTSVTGSTLLKERIWGSYNYAPSDAVINFALNIPTNYKSFSQEARIVTAFPDSPVNGLVGIFYEDSKLTGSVRNYLASAKVFDQHTDGTAFSIYGQLLINLTDQLELAGGGRWSHEKKRFDVFLNGVAQAVGRDDATFKNFSPEATLTFRPNSQFTAYAAYKTGFKSGGFAYTLTHLSPATAAIGLNNFYKPEKVRGGEIGIKTALANNRVRLNVAAYYNKFTDLQVTSLDNSTGFPVFRINNAASAEIKGIEGDIQWRPAGVEGLSLRAALNYNIAKYKSFVAPCAIGQTIQEGCTLAPNALGAFTAQDLSGEPLLNAPRWNGSLGASYDSSLGGSGIWGGVNFDLTYKSRYTPHADQQPWSYQNKVAFLNGSVRVYAENNLWEVAVIGKNLTNRYRVTAASNVPITGIGTRTGTAVEGGRAELVGYVNRGREVLIQLTFRPGS